MTCLFCKSTFSVPFGLEPTELCNPCAQALAACVLDACVTSWVPTTDKAPKELLHALLMANQQVALDPAVSQAAKELQEAAYNAGITQHSMHCASVHTEPLLQAVIDADLPEHDTEGPTGGGGVDHAHTIALMGQRLRWIPVTERLPVNETNPLFDGPEVLATSGNETLIAYVRMDMNDDALAHWSLPNGFDFRRVTHWMPLPTPPKEKM